MDALDFLRGKISEFPGYSGANERERSDELIRSYLGEAIAEAQTRLGRLDSDLEQRIGDLLVRAGFANQAAFKAYADAARNGMHVDAVADADARTVEMADRAAHLTAPELYEFITQAQTMLDERDAAMDAVR